MLANEDFQCKLNSPNSSILKEPFYFSKGSQPTDGGNLLFTNDEKGAYLKVEPEGGIFIKPFVNAREYLHNEQRWCFWLSNISPNIFRQLPELRKRIDKIRQFRLKSTKIATKKWAQFPALFTENWQPDSDYILIPRHTSENRKYIPIGLFSKEFIVADSCNSIPDATLYHFGVLTSEMHQVWIKYICGRIKSDYRYSNDIVYNNFPWPENTTEKQQREVEEAARKVLEVREKYLSPAPVTTDKNPEPSRSGSPVHPFTCSPVPPFTCSPSKNTSLADLYDPLTMPPDLVKAHRELDRAVDLYYPSAALPQ
jgi:hypothetical protein